MIRNFVTKVEEKMVDHHSDMTSVSSIQRNIEKQITAFNFQCLPDEKEELRDRERELDRQQRWIKNTQPDQTVTRVIICFSFLNLLLPGCCARHRLKVIEMMWMVNLLRQPRWSCFGESCWIRSWPHFFQVQENGIERSLENGHVHPVPYDAVHLYDNSRMDNSRTLIMNDIERVRERDIGLHETDFWAPPVSETTQLCQAYILKVIQVNQTKTTNLWGVKHWNQGARLGNYN